MSWHDSDREDTTTYKVVINHEEQYSIWPSDRENPLGWQDVGKSGTKAECLEYIDEVWTDMRPLSLRKRMEQAAQEAQSRPAQAGEGEASDDDGGHDLVDRLSKGSHPVEVSLRPEKNLRAFKESIARRYVHIKFIDTKGGTELGVSIDGDAIDPRLADLNDPSGTVHLVGDLTLDYKKVRCHADIDLETLTGRGHLEPV